MYDVMYEAENAFCNINKLPLQLICEWFGSQNWQNSRMLSLPDEAEMKFLNHEKHNMVMFLQFCDLPVIQIILGSSFLYPFNLSPANFTTSF
jgi:hypothetical protein